jgi:hypothetical protein
LENCFKGGLHLNIVVESKGIQTANFLLGRLGAIPSSNMDKLLFKDSSNYQEQHYYNQQELKRQKQAVVDLLFNVVSSMGENKELSRYTLKLKRDIYNDRKVKIDYKMLEQIKPLMNHEEISLLYQWIELYKRNNEIKVRLKEIYPIEIEKINKELMLLIESESAQEMLKGVVIASKDYAKSLIKDKKKLLNHRSNFSKTTFSYLQRSTVKTSPFSTFTQLSAVPLTGQKNRLSTNRKSSIKLNRAILSWLLEQIGITFKEYFKFKFNETVEIDGSYYFVKSLYMNSDGFLWKSEDVIKNKSIYEVFSKLPNKMKEDSFFIEELISALGEKSKFHMRTFISSKILRPVIPFDLYEENTIAKMASYLEEKKVPNKELVDILYQMDNLITLLGLFELNINQRLETIEKLKAFFYQISNLLNLQIPTWFSAANIVYEDVQSDIKEINLPDRLEERLQTVHKKVSQQIIVNPLYHMLVEQFLKKNPGKKCKLLDFVFTTYSSGSDNLDYRRMVNQSRHDILNPNFYSNDINGNSIAAPTTSIYFQFASELLNTEENKLVINKISSGAGNILARFGSLLGKAYREELRNWINGNFKNSKTAEFSIGEDWSNLQENFSVLEDVITSVAELPYQNRKKRIDISMLELVYNDQYHSLDIVDEFGDYISPVYLGTIPQHLLNGPIGILLTLVNPWIVQSDFGINPRPWENESKEVTEINFISRVEEDNIVYKRAEWQIPSHKLPLKRHEETDLDYFVRLNDFRLEYNIPVETYITFSYKGSAMNQKPIWMHFSNPHCIELLNKKSKEDLIYVTFTEALPSSNDANIVNHLNQPMVAEFISLNRSDIDNG